jgi:hypothetical protein
VPQQLLHNFDIFPIGVQQRRKRVTKGMPRDLQADYGVPITPWKLDSFCVADYRTFDLRVGI